MTNEKKAKWIYWLLTAPFVITMLTAGILLLSGFGPNVEGITQLGYPAYLCQILGLAKILASIAIPQNRFRTLKEWAYVGYSLNLMGAAASHALHGDDAGKIITPLAVLVFVLGSYWQWKRMNSLQKSKNLNEKTSVQFIHSNQ